MEQPLHPGLRSLLHHRHHRPCGRRSRGTAARRHHLPRLRSPGLFAQMWTRVSINPVLGLGWVPKLVQ